MGIGGGAVAELAIDVAAPLPHRRVGPQGGGGGVAGGDGAHLAEPGYRIPSSGRRFDETFPLLVRGKQTLSITVDQRGLDEPLSFT